MAKRKTKQAEEPVSEFYNSAKYSYNRYNYWNIPLDELPTRGLFYNKNAKIKLRSMSLLEIKFLATYQPQIATEICNEIIAKCAYFENIKIEDLYLPDRMYLAFWIRNNSFINRSGYTVSVPECQSCKNPYNYDIRLEDFSIVYLDDFINHVYLPDCNIDLPLTIPKFNDSLYKVTDDITSAALYINSTDSFTTRVNFIENLTAKDYTILNAVLKHNFCGFKEDFIITCPHCHTSTHANIKITDENLFNAIKLFEILDTITKIAKYSHLQITNDWTWIEIELEQDVINKMIKEEEEANKRELAKSRQS